jgi:hypothetical protein
MIFIVFVMSTTHNTPQHRFPLKHFHPPKALHAEVFLPQLARQCSLFLAKRLPKFVCTRRCTRRYWSQARQNQLQRRSQNFNKIQHSKFRENSKSKLQSEA